MPSINASDISNNAGQLSKARVTTVSVALVLTFLAFFFIDPNAFSNVIDSSFHWSARWFGLFWQLLLLINFAVALTLACRPAAAQRLGGLQEPEFSTFQWIAMVLCTLLAGGGVFWAAAEPIAHSASLPPLFADKADPLSEESVRFALAQSFLHWGFLAWSILGSLGAILLMRLHYEKGLPLAPRTLLYPLLGETGVRGKLGDIADIVSVLAVFAGTVGPIGFLGLQISYGVGVLYDLPDNKMTQIITIALLMLVYLTSAVSGMHRGIQMLSRANIILGLFLLAFILLVGPTRFIVDGFVTSLGTHLTWFGEQALFRGEAGWFGDPGWLSLWTVFFWGWFIGYSPMMAIFIARVSRGRRARDVILLMSMVAPLLTMAWFSIIGGAGLGLEMRAPGSISSPFEGFNLPAVLLAITGGLPMSEVITGMFLLLTVLFVATTGDSMTYSLSVVSSGLEHPPRWLRLFWGIAMGVTAMVLLAGPSGGIGKLQSFIVVTAVPVSLLLIPSLWGVFGALGAKERHA
ncbi:BCCT family transporter [Congregibacter sp.]|uniref:BCCT family transporter n=1 Tax=Congregibacter sp. TaxID=2744308 RepID=UPI003F6AD38D